MTRHTALLRLIPPPPRWRPLLRLAPTSLRERLMAGALTQALAPEHIGSALDDIAGRRLGIEVSDLGLHCVLRWRGGRLHAVQAPAEATVRGTATDLLLLAARLEDADTLFFQRRLVLTGDTELGLTVRNLLDRMPWEALPLGLRIVLYRGARLARDAREARRG
ncbi:MAG TPA: SCP2 sterol-binding domain-containing protein [Luteimonas sp.]|nr:SCP2 sterol-binding domain-containing protein [Luteimonas sp.]